MHCRFSDNSETRNWAKKIWIHFQQVLYEKYQDDDHVEFPFYWMNTLTKKILHNQRINIQETGGEIISRFHLYGVVKPDIILWTNVINHFNAVVNLWTHFGSVSGIHFKLWDHLFLFEEHSLRVTWQWIQR